MLVTGVQDWAELKIRKKSPHSSDIWGKAYLINVFCICYLQKKCTYIAESKN